MVFFCLETRKSPVGEKKVPSWENFFPQLETLNKDIIAFVTFYTNELSDKNVPIMQSKCKKNGHTFL